MKVSLSRYPPKPHLLVARYPYDPAVNEIIKTIPGREFNDPLKAWLIPGTPENVLALFERLRLRGHALYVPAELAASLREEWDAVQSARAVRKAGDSDIAFDYLTEPYAHQRAGLAFLTHLGSGALLWEMGLGKTKTAIDYAEWLAQQHRTTIRPGQAGDYWNRTPEEYPASAWLSTIRVLVIAPKTVCRNWMLEITKHAGHADFEYLADGPLVGRARLLAESSQRYAILNCEALSHKVIAEALRAVEWDLAIVDESTRFKTPKAARTKALHRLRAKRRIILTGTPITGRPEDAWSQFEFVSPGLFGRSFWAFRDRYLARDFFGNVTGLKADTADELKERLDSRSYRILKADVLDLPPKVYLDRRVTLADDQARAYAQMRDELRVEIENTPRLTATNILTMLLRLTQITAGLVGTSDTGYRWIEDGAKVSDLDGLVREELAGEQVVIFGLYQRELEELAARYANVERPMIGGEREPGPPIIYGPTKELRRAELIAQFQAGDRRLLFVQSRTGGLGINLTAAKTAIYHTRGWGLEEYLQSQDRLHRIGQTGTVSIVHLVAEKTIDEDIAAALAEKQQLADHLTGDGARKLAAQVLGRK